ncbi:PREDICTED: uncharacterized protein KIAA1210 homolog [Elephantulus edwardii]|uniref:uncharacterized protein KIAA1210 homolog n=1 Tax=Elephantulus edwardii TaxID=28737 RepID=UPI0003F0BCDA|nr:PREDICTED: uncharacterized protein KIAA1210 homolog [Elephantulus edwardii]
MAESLSEVSEALDATEEGRRKSKFRALVNFFERKGGVHSEKPGGSKEDAGAEADDEANDEIDESRSRRTPTSSSSLPITSLKSSSSSKPPGSRPKDTKRTKTTSRESIFHLEPESEKSSSKTSSSPDSQRSGSQQSSRSLIRQSRISPYLTCDVYEEVVLPEESNASRQKTLSPKVLTAKKSSSEASSEPCCSQSLTTLSSPSRTVVCPDFSTPATSQGCLDSSAAKHKMSLNPRKQKITRTSQVIVQPKSEETSFPQTHDAEKKMTQPKEAGIEKKMTQPKEGLPCEEWSNRTEICDKTLQRRHGKRGSIVLGMNDDGIQGRCFKSLRQSYELEDRPESPLVEKMSKDRPFGHLLSEKQVKEKLPAPKAETTTPQKLPSDKKETEVLYSIIDHKGKKALPPPRTQEDVSVSVVAGPPSYNEGRAFGSKKTDIKRPPLSVVQSPCAPQEIVTPSVTVENKELPPYQKLSGQEIASTTYSKSAHLKMESAQDMPNIKEKAIQTRPCVLKASIVDPVSLTVKRRISIERMQSSSLPCALEETEPCQVSKSEKESNSEEHMASKQSFQSSEKPRYEQKVLSKSESMAVKSHSVRPQMAHRYSAQALGKPEDEKEVFAQPKSGIEGAGAHQKQQIPRWLSLTLREPEKKSIISNSYGYVEKYYCCKNWNSSEEDLPLGKPLQALEKPEEKILEKNKNDTVEQQPSRPPLQPLMKQLNQQISSRLISSSTEQGGGSMEPKFAERSPCQSGMNPEFKHQDPEGTAEQGISTTLLPSSDLSGDFKMHKRKQWVFPERINVEDMVPLKCKIVRRHPKPPRSLFDQEVFVRPKVLTAEENIPEKSENIQSADVTDERISTNLKPPRRVFQLFLAAKAEPQASSVVGNSTSEEQQPSTCFSQPSMNLKEEPKEVPVPEDVAVQRDTSVVTLPKYSSSTFAKCQQVLFKSTAMGDDTLRAQLPPEGSCQPMMRSQAQPQINRRDSISISAEKRSFMESPVPKQSSQSLVKPNVEKQASLGPKSAPLKGDISVKITECYPKSLVTPTVKQGTFGSMSNLVPLRGSLQPRASPKFEQQVSAGPAPAAVVEETSMKQLPPRESLSVVKQKAQQSSSSFEGIALEGGIYKRPMPSRYPAPFLIKSKAQEKPSHLGIDTVEEDIPKKSMLPKYPSQSFVKFMVQQVFSVSDNPPVNKGLYASPVPLTDPSKSLVKPKFEQQAQAQPGKPMPMKSSLQALGKPEDQKEVVPQNTPERESSSKEKILPRQLFMALEKLEQEITVSENSHKKLKSSGEKLPPTGQALEDAKEKKLVPSRSMSAPAEKIILKSDPGSSLSPRGPPYPGKTQRQSQSSQDQNKCIPPLAPKLAKFTGAPAPQTPISGAPPMKKESVWKSDQIDSQLLSSPTVAADIENVFGVKLRRTFTLHTFKNDKQEDIPELLGSPSSPTPSYIEEGEAAKKADVSESLTTMSNVPKMVLAYEDIIKKESACKIPATAPGQQSDSTTSEPVWVSMAKRRQCIPFHEFNNSTTANKLSTTRGVRAKDEAEESLWKGCSPENENQPRTTMSTVSKQMMAVERVPAEEKMAPVAAIGKEPRKSAAFPEAHKEPVESDEPIWFAMAKEKSKAWSYLADVMQ